MGASHIESVDGNSIERGLLTTTTIWKGQTIATYVGSHINSMEYALKDNEQGGYVLQASQNKYLDCYEQANLTKDESYWNPRYLNLIFILILGFIRDGFY